MRKNEARYRKLTLGGAVVGAVVASSCCLVPLVLAGFGVAGGGALMAFAEYRPYILALAFVLLALGFYFMYRRPKAAGDDACGCERPKVGRAGRVGLWVATALVALFAAAPALIEVVQTSAAPPAVPRAVGAATARVHMRVQGMTCPSCVGQIRAALANVGGLHDLTADLSTRSIEVTYEPAHGRLEAYAAALGARGYAATLPSSTPSAAPDQAR